MLTPAAPAGECIASLRLCLKRLDELVNEARDLYEQSASITLGPALLADLDSAPLNQISSMGGKERVKHIAKVVASTSAGPCATVHTPAAGNAQRAPAPAQPHSKIPRRLKLLHFLHGFSPRGIRTIDNQNSSMSRTTFRKPGRSTGLVI